MASGTYLSSEWLVWAHGGADNLNLVCYSLSRKAAWPDQSKSLLLFEGPCFLIVTDNPLAPKNSPGPAGMRAQKTL